MSDRRNGDMPTASISPPHFSQRQIRADAGYSVPQTLHLNWAMRDSRWKKCASLLDVSDIARRGGHDVDAGLGDEQQFLAIEDTLFVSDPRLDRENQPVLADRLLVKGDMRRLRAHQSHAVPDSPRAERHLDAVFPKCSFGGLGNLAQRRAGTRRADHGVIDLKDQLLSVLKVFRR